MQRHADSKKKVVATSSKLYEQGVCKIRTRCVCKSEASLRVQDACSLGALAQNTRLGHVRSVHVDETSHLRTERRRTCSN